MGESFAVFDGRVNGVIWGKKKGDFRIGAPDSLNRHMAVARELGISDGRLIFPTVGHGALVGVYGKVALRSLDGLRWRTEEQCDAFFMPANGKTGIAYMPADCSIVVMTGERHSELYLALIHCGWREILAGVIGNTIRTFRDIGVSRLSIRALATPCIGSCCLRVELEVAKAFMRKFPGKHFCIRKSENELSLNLRRAVAAEIEESDIRKFTIMDGCTSCDTANYWSHRRGDKERNIVAVALAS